MTNLIYLHHGLSYSKYSCNYNKIKAEQTLSIPINDSVELWDVKIKNEDDKERSLSVFSYCEFSYHHIDMDNPIAVEKGVSTGSYEKGGNHCGSLQKKIVLRPGEEVRIVFMLGEGNRETGKLIKEKYSNLSNVDKVYADLKGFWNNKLNKLQIIIRIISSKIR